MKFKKYFQLDQSYVDTSASLFWEECWLWASTSRCRYEHIHMLHTPTLILLDTTTR